MVAVDDAEQPREGRERLLSHDPEAACANRAAMGEKRLGDLSAVGFRFEPTIAALGDMPAELERNVGH